LSTAISVQEPQRRLSIFLDTNALHFCRLWLEIARQEEVYPFGSNFNDAKSLDDKIKQVLGQGGSANSSYASGYKIVHHLREVTIDSEGRTIGNIMFAPMTRLEASCGALRGKAILAAAQERVSSRWWNRVDENEIIGRLIAEDYTDVLNDIKGIEDDFFGAGMTILAARNEELTFIWFLADTLFGLVFTDPTDCLIYATALLLASDEIISEDAYLRKVITSIHNPGASPLGQHDYFFTVQAKVRQCLAGISGVSESEIILPRPWSAKMPKVGT